MRFKIIIGVLVLIITSLAIWYFVPKTSNLNAANNSKSNAPAANKNNKNKGMRGNFNAPTPVRVTSAQMADFSIYYKALGTAVAQNTANVRSRVSGQLVEILFKEGQQVSKNTVLAKIDQRSYQAALAAAHGALLQAQAQLKNAELDLKRYQDLFAEDSIAAQTLDTQAALVAQYQGQVKANEARYMEAKLNLEFTQIKAPISGRLGLKQVDIGNLVGAGDTKPLVTITQTKPIMVQFTLPERELPLIISQYRRGDKLEVEVWDRDDKILLGVGILHSLDNQIDTATGTLKLKAEFANDNEVLLPNQFVNVKIKAQTITDAIIIESDAVQYGENGAYVYVVNNDTVRLQPISVGVLNNAQIVIEEGLKEGDLVVLEGTDRLRDGAKVTVVNPSNNN